MASEHLVTINAASVGVYRFPIPKGGAIMGVYATAPIAIAYNDNSSIGQLYASTTAWEPPAGFIPAAFAELQLTTTAANTAISIRYRT